MTTWTPRFQKGDCITWGNVINKCIKNVDLINNTYEFYLNGNTGTKYGDVYGLNIDNGINTQYIKTDPAVLISGPSKIGGKRKRSRRKTSRNKKSKRRVQKRKSFKKRKHL